MSALPLSALIELCRTLRHSLGAGLTLVDVFRQQANRGSTAIQPVAGEILAELETGSSLEEALKPHQGRFPPLLLALAGVGEQSGALPEIFGELEKFFRLQQQLRRQFWSQISMPIFQFVVGTLALAGMLFVLGLFDSKFDPLGFGLTGTSGAITLLAIIWGTVGAVLGGYWLLTRSLRRKAKVDAFLLNVPTIGPCLRTFALHRFCVALRLTTESAMSIHRAMRLSLRATGNQAFVAKTDVVLQSLKAGEEIHVSLAPTGLFPEEFLNILANAEHSGRLTEVLEHQSEYYEDESRRRLTALTKVAGAGVWVLVAALIVFAIFRIFLTYLAMLNSFGA